MFVTRTEKRCAAGPLGAENGEVVTGILRDAQRIGSVAKECLVGGVQAGRDQ